MARVQGTIRSAGAGVGGLRVVAFEETRIGFELDDKPCRASHPVIENVGEATTNGEGRFAIDFEPRPEPAFACSFSATVRVSVFDSATLVWRSSKRPVRSVVRFDHDILPGSTGSPDEPTARVFGTLTRCSDPAEGLRVVLYEETVAGFPLPPKPCVKSFPSIRSAGTAIVDAQGRFTIAYTPTPEIPDACSFSATVRVEAFDNAQGVWRSSAKPVATNVRFDHELYPDCPAGSSFVRVVDVFGDRVAGAEVYLNGALEGTTDSLGQITVESLAAGDTLTARQLLLENETPREAHDVDSERNWSYRVYKTSATLEHDANGDDPAFEQHVVSDPTERQDLVVRRTNALVAFNVRVSVEWCASLDELTYLRDRMLETSELLFNATDGQFVIERLEIADGASHWDDADYQVFADWDQPSNATLGAVAGDTGRIRLNPYDALFPGTLLHELGHYALFLKDEYKAADCWPDGEPVRCTLQSSTPGSTFSEGASKDACVMRGARFGSRKKICSSHPSNPHVDCTAQGPEDCWSVIVQRYGGLPAWRLLTPVSRGAVVARLPDSVVPSGIATMPPPGADQAGSYIPVREWRPRWHISRRSRPNECSRLIVRAMVGVAPASGAQVTLVTADGRSIYQGRTGAKDLPDGTSTAAGEITIRGAHVGDSVELIVGSGSGAIRRIAVIEDCASPMVVTLQPVVAPIRMRTRPIGVDGVEFDVETQCGSLISSSISVSTDGGAEPFLLDLAPHSRERAHRALMPAGTSDTDHELMVTAFADGGEKAVLRSRLAIRHLMVDGARTVESARGELELVLPAGSVPCPALLVTEDALDVPGPKLGDGDRLVIAPHRIGSSHGDALYATALLHLNPGVECAGATGRCADGIEVLALVDGGDGWQRLCAVVNEEPLVATVSIRRLGAFALVRRTDRTGT